MPSFPPRAGQGKPLGEALGAARREALARAGAPDGLLVLDGLPDAIIAADAGNRIVYANRAAESLLGWPPDRLVGRSVAATLVPARLRDAHLAGFRRVVETGEGRMLGRPVRLAALRRDGSEVEIELALTQLRLPLGVLLVASIRDAGERIELERRSALAADLVHILAGGGSLQDTTMRVLQAVGQTLGWDVGAVWVLDPRTGLLSCAEVWHAPGVQVPEFEAFCRMVTLRKGMELPGRVWAAHEPVWIRDVADDASSPRTPIALREGLHGAFGFPVTQRGEFLGVVEFLSQQVREPDPALLETMASVGSELGTFVARRTSEEQVAFQKALLESQSEASIDGILVVSPRGSILYANSRFAQMWGIPEEVLETRSDRAALESVLDKLEEPEGFLARVEHLYRDPAATSRDEIVLKDGRVFDRHSAPVRGADGTLYGRVWHFRDVTDRHRAAREMAALYEAEAGARRDLSFLLDASSALAYSLDQMEGLRRLARLAVAGLADVCLVDVMDGTGAVRRVAAVHTDPSKQRLADELARRPPDPRGPNPSARVLRTGRTEHAPELGEELVRMIARDERHLEVARELRVRSYVCVPLAARGRVFGVISLIATADSGRGFSGADVALAEELGRRAAVAVDNARLYGERSHIARTLQRSLVPPELPEIGGVELAAYHRPGGEAVEVGGDFYDVFQSGEEEWVLVIGDVCGKGVEAAALTALARHTVRAGAIRDRDPRRLLLLLNEAVLRHGSGDFCTLACVRLERAGGDGSGGFRAVAASGGHPPPLVVRGAGTVETVECRGALLGVVGDPGLAPASAELRPGDALVLYTDGLIEARRMGNLRDEEDLMRLLGQCSGAGASSIAAALRRTIEPPGGTPPRDDVAFLVARILP